MIPIPKGKAGPDISSYRPVAVLLTPTKVYIRNGYPTQHTKTGRCTVIECATRFPAGT